MAKNPVGSYRGHTVHSTAGVHKLFGPAGPTLFTGVGAQQQLRSHVDTLFAGTPMKNPKKNGQSLRMNGTPPLAELDRLFPNYDPYGPEEVNFSAVYALGLEKGLSHGAAATFADKFNSHRASCGHCSCPPKKNGAKTPRMNPAPTLKQLESTFPNYDSTKSAEYEEVWAYLHGLNLPRDVADKLTDKFNSRMWKKAGHHVHVPPMIEFAVNPKTRRNHHLAVGTPVLSAGHIARIIKQLPKDYYTIKYVDTGSLRTVRGSTLNKK